MENRDNPALSLRAVRALPAEVARKIAAGEVIDRPAAVVRELLDNAIDSGATKITVEISGGGVDGIRVTDNGSGMTAEDLALCTQTHTTSKISAEDDLLSLATLGFRGEALSSIQAVSSLEITTTRNGHDAWKLEFGKVIPAVLAKGTIVKIDGLFSNFPARRQFMKRASAETALCRQVFTEKALAWPDIDFRFSSDGVQKILLPPAQTLRERCLAAFGPKEGENFFYEIAGSGEGFGFQAVLGSPEVVRADRRELMVFVNGRRIMEYSLLQAIEYGAEGHFPNGGHPFGCLFVSIDPALVDFNIHPAKREARFRDPSSLHHAVSSVIRDFFRRYATADLKREAFADIPDHTYGRTVPGNLYVMDSLPPQQAQQHSPAAEYARMAAGSPPPANPLPETAAFREAVYNAGVAPAILRFLGQVLGTFLAVEKNGILYLIDQHAAHERILYDELFARSSETQELLIPYRIETESASEDRHLENNRENLFRAGFSVENEGDGMWQVTAVPARWTGTQKNLSEELRDLSVGPEALVSHLYATAACRAACKDGDVLDAATARNLVERAFALDEPVCPHGRPIWIMLDREELFRRIRRT